MLNTFCSQILTARGIALLAIIFLFAAASLVGSPGASAYLTSSVASNLPSAGVCDQLDQAKQAVQEKTEQVRILSERENAARAAVNQAKEALRRPADLSEVQQAEDAKNSAEARYAEAQQALAEARTKLKNLGDQKDQVSKSGVTAERELSELRSKLGDARRLQEKVNSDRKVTAFTQESEKLVTSIRAEVGGFDIENLDGLLAKINDDAFPGEDRSRLGNLYRNKQRKEELADQQSVDVIVGQIKALRRSVKAMIERLKTVKETDLPLAQFQATERLSDSDKALLRELDLGFLQRRVDEAQKKLDALDALQHDRSFEQTRQSIERLEQLVHERYEERTAAIEALRTARSAHPTSESVLTNATQAQNEATRQLEAAKVALAEARRRIKELEQARQALEEQVKNLIESGRTAGRAGNAANKDARKDDCLKNFSSARGLFMSARELADANPCLDPKLLQKVNQYLAEVEGTSCQGDRLGPPPKEDGGFKDAGPSVDKSARTGPAPIQPSDPNNPHVSRAQAAIASCDFGRARASLDQYQPADPNDPWMAAKYKEIFRAQEKLDSTQALLAQAADILRQAEPSREQILYASSLVKEARNRAPGCISQRVSVLTPAVNEALGAADQRERERTAQQRERTREAIATALTGIVDAIAQVQQARDGSSSPSVSEQPAGGATGNAGGCGGCLITGLGQYKKVTYVFERSYVANGCHVTAYSIFSMSPTDEDGRPTDRLSPNEEAALGRGYGQKRCGPCTSYQQALDWIKSQCPNPKAVNIVP